MTVVEKIGAFFKRSGKTVKASQPESAAGAAEKKVPEAAEKKTGEATSPQSSTEQKTS